MQWLNEHWPQIIRFYMLAALVVPALTLLLGLWVRTRRTVVYCVIVGGLAGGLYALGGIGALKIAGLIVGALWLPLWPFVMLWPLGIVKGVKEKQSEDYVEYCDAGCKLVNGQVVEADPYCPAHGRY